MKSSYFRLAFAVACTGIIVNAAAAQTVQFETSALLVNGTSMTVNVIITSAPSTPVTVQIGTLDGTAFSPGDYTAASGTLVFPAGSISPQSFTVTGINTASGGKQFYLQMSNLTGPATLGTALITVTIQAGLPGGGGGLGGGGGGSGGSPTPVTVQFASPTYTVNENGLSASIQVSLSAAPTATVKVNYATSNGAAPNGAIAGLNYTSTSGTLTFTPDPLPGGTPPSQTFTVPILDDGIAGPNRTVNLTLSAPDGATLGTQSTAVLTIVDTDLPPVTVSFEPHHLVRIEYRESVTLPTKINPAYAAPSIAFISTKPAVATVSGNAPNPTVAGLEIGLAKIVAKYEGKAVGYVIVAVEAKRPEAIINIVGVAPKDKNEPGGFVQVNANNDNGSKLIYVDPDAGEVGEGKYGIPTMRDFDPKNVKLKAPDPDLLEITLETNNLAADAKNAIVFSPEVIKNGRGKIQVWDTATKNNLIKIPAFWTKATMPKSVFVEGLLEGADLREITLFLQIGNGKGYVQDTCTLTVTPVLTNFLVSPAKGAVPDIENDFQLGWILDTRKGGGGMPAFTTEISRLLADLQSRFSINWRKWAENAKETPPQLPLNECAYLAQNRLLHHHRFLGFLAYITHFPTNGHWGSARSVEISAHFKKVRGNLELIQTIKFSNTLKDDSGADVEGGKKYLYKFPGTRRSVVDTDEQKDVPFYMARQILKIGPKDKVKRGPFQ